MALRKSQAALNRDLKHRVLTCLNKLSDRDTHSAAASELESIAITLSHETIPPFLSSIAATDAADKSPVRKQCIRIISLLSEVHGDALSPYLSKLLSAVVRRLRDPDSAVRSACVHATASISSHITKPPFASILKPLIDALVTEQDHNSQIGAALCLAAAIDASSDPEPLYLKKLLPRFEKLLKSNSFRAKPALLTLIGSVIDAGAASTDQILKNLVPCLVAFVGSEDWTARKAAAEALVKLAVVEREVLAGFKAACLKTFEAKKFDKVKIVRETMNHLVDAWEKIADVSGEASLPPELQSLSKENASDGQYPPGSKTSCTPQMRKKRIPVNRSALPDGSLSTTAKKRSPVDSSEKKSGPAMFRKLDRKKPTDQKIEIVAPHTPVMTKDCEDDPRRRDEKGIENGERLRSKFMNPETRRTLFSKDSDGKMLKFGGVDAGSCVVPCHGDVSESTVAASNITQDMHKNQKEGEDLILIRKQLVQIENQQSSVLDLLQKFIGSSENGMHSLETRVQGLELALDEISYDLAVTTGRKSKIDSEQTMCCKLPGAELFSPKFWRRAQLSSSRGKPLIAALRNVANNNGNAETSKLENRRLRVQRSGGFIVNPLAEIHSDSHTTSEVSSNLILKNVPDAL